MLDNQWRLTADDACFYLREYTSRAGFGFSETNQLISNFKKEPSKRNRPTEWRHKLAAIERIARELAQALGPEALSRVTLVPMPPSVVRGEPEHDDRMLQVLRQIEKMVREKLDIRDVLVLRETIRKSRAGSRVEPEELRRVLAVDPDSADPLPRTIYLFDDLITQGTHFRVAKDLLLQHYQTKVRIVGIFVARVVELDLQRE